MYDRSLVTYGDLSLIVLQARLEASQALNNELQRALVDAHTPQVRRTHTTAALPSRCALDRHDHVLCRAAHIASVVLGWPPMSARVRSASWSASAELQEQGGRCRGFVHCPGLPVIMEKDCEDAAAASPAPVSPFPTADVALHLANTTNQVLQGRLQSTAGLQVLTGVHIRSSRGGP